MSRLIVKNLPKTIKEEEVRTMFATKGRLTDCRLVFTKEGLFRRFAFIGYTTEDEAAECLKFYNQTFMGTSKIQIEYCKPFGDNSKPRAWSKYANDRSAFSKRNAAIKGPIGMQSPKSVTTCSGSHLFSDSQFRDFLALRGQSQFSETSANNTNTVHSVSNCQNDAFINGLPMKIKPATLRQFLKPVKPISIEFPVSGATADAKHSSARLTLSNSKDLSRVLCRNGEHLGGYKLTITRAYAFGTKTEDKHAESDPVASKDLQEIERQRIDQIADTGRIFVRNLSYLCTEDNLRKLFEPFGSLADVNLPVDLFTKKQKGYAVITFLFPEQAVKAYEKLDGSIFLGRMLHLIPGKEKPEAAIVEGSSGNKSFKASKLAHQKQTASAMHNWNTLFVGANAVADAVSLKYDQKKSAVLNVEQKKSLGVRLALGETEVIQQTRDFLLENGVALDSFSQADKPRSKTVILVKNLPSATPPGDIRQMFEKFGTVGRVILPSHGCTAIVEFVESHEAMAAFKALAFRKFKTVPLLLEWAPGEVFAPAADRISASNAEQSGTSANEASLTSVPQQEQQVTKQKQTISDDEEEETEDTEPEVGTTVFVKNLNFETTDESLRQKFEHIGPLVYATVSRKKDPRNASNRLSMGYGFVQYFKAAHALTALKELQGVHLDQYALELKLSERVGLQSDSSNARTRNRQKEKKQTTTKILVRNVPFQATANEIRELFAVFGSLKIVRLPKKIGSDAHRGFAFVDFVSKSDARKAFKALCHSTHLYGRRLVLEWADAEETVDGIRKRTAEHFHTGESRARKIKRAKKILETLDRHADAVTEDQ